MKTQLNVQKRDSCFHQQSLMSVCLVPDLIEKKVSIMCWTLGLRSKTNVIRAPSFSNNKMRILNLIRQAQNVEIVKIWLDGMRRKARALGYTITLIWELLKKEPNVKDIYHD